MLYTGCEFDCMAEQNAPHFRHFATQISAYSSFYNVKSYTNLSLMMNEQKIAIQNFQTNLHLGYTESEVITNSPEKKQNKLAPQTQHVQQMCNLYTLEQVRSAAKFFYITSSGFKIMFHSSLTGLATRECGSRS